MKKMLYLFLFSPLCLFGQTLQTEKGINFDHASNFAQLLERSGKENKMIMVDAYTTWCGPCKWMANNIFPNDTVAAYYNSNFINAKIDMEKGEGVDLAKKYLVTAYPTFLFIDNNGELLHRMSGSMQAKDFVELGSDAMNPAKQFASAQRKYDSGNMNPDEMGEYLLMRAKTNMDVKEVMAKYFSTQKDSDLINLRNWSILSHCAWYLRADCREFRYLVDHHAEFDKLYSEKEVSKIISNGYVSALENYLKDKNAEGYLKLKEEIKKKNIVMHEDRVMLYDLEYYKQKSDWAEYTQTGEKFIEEFGKEKQYYLNLMAWNFYENVSDKVMLAKAEAWAKRSVELDTNYENTDTYACLQYKLGKKMEAQATAERAIELAKKDGKDFKETQALLDKIKAMK